MPAAILLATRRPREAATGLGAAMSAFSLRWRGSKLITAAAAAAGASLAGVVASAAAAGGSGATSAPWQLLATATATAPQPQSRPAPPLPAQPRLPARVQRWRRSSLPVPPPAHPTWAPHPRAALGRRVDRDHVLGHRACRAPARRLGIDRGCGGASSLATTSQAANASASVAAGFSIVGIASSDGSAVSVVGAASSWLGASRSRSASSLAASGASLASGAVVSVGAARRRGSCLLRRRLGRGRRIRCGSWPGQRCELQHDCIDLAAQLDQLALQGFHIQRGRCDGALDGRNSLTRPQTNIGTRLWFIGYWSPEP